MSWPRKSIPRALPAALLLAAALLCLLPGCKKGKDKGTRGEAEEAARRANLPIPEQERIPPPEVLPTYSFASAEVERRYPEITTFLREFFETCLNGDYLGYRKLVSRFEPPESKERFTVIYYALRNSRIDSIEPIAHDDAGKPTLFRVLTSVEFADEAKLALRKPNRNRQIAILVVSEEGRWRMKPAPASLQPRDPSSQPTSGPTGSAPAEDPLPEYPWDADGDS